MQVYVSQKEWDYWRSDNPDMREFPMGEEAFQGQVTIAQNVFGLVRIGIFMLCCQAYAACKIGMPGPRSTSRTGCTGG